MSRFALSVLVASSLLLACGEPEEVVSADEAALAAKADEHWFYTGDLPRLDDAKIVVSLEGHTARVSGTLPATFPLPSLPHVKVKIEGDKQRLDIVYPIATAAPNKYNSRPGRYAFHLLKPYRPNGAAFTRDEGWHDVPWGGFPFIAYNQGIAFHGPITAADNASPRDLTVWYLQRGPVSGGCNRMLGEHVLELAHVIGAPMTRVYRADEIYGPQRPPMNVTAPVDVIADYDSYDGKLIDVDYPTHGSAVRPARVVGAENVVMFGSWIGTETPDGRDFPRNMAWEGGISGRPYVFAEHSLPNRVCSMPKALLPALKELTGGGDVPRNLCANKACYLDALANGGAAAARERCLPEALIDPGP